MLSTDLRTHDFGTWMKFNRSNASTILASLPTEPGVFVVRSRKPIARAKGNSDIVFIGVGANKQGGLKMRIEQVYSPGSSQSTNHRLIQAITGSDDYELAVAECRTAQEANALKRRLFDQYERDHLELPPLSLHK